MAITRLQFGDYSPETGYTKYPEPITVTTYEGRVLEVFREEYRAMSDVYTIATFARVVEEDGTIKKVLVNANFECDLSEGRATVDATPQAQAIWNFRKEEEALLRRIRDEEARLAMAEKEKNRPEKGKKMEVFKGRKVPVGTVGVVAYVSASGNVLLKDENTWQDRKANGVWVSAENLRAV